MSVRTLGQTVRSGTATAFRTFVIGLAVYGGLDLIRNAMAQDAGTAYLPVTANAEEITSLEDRVAALEDLLVHVSREGNDIYVTGANLHVVNGTGATETTNGLGIVIIGYNETRVGNYEVNDRSGSHTLVVGSGNNYTSYGGIVVGKRNSTSGSFASVSGGSGNEASGVYASVSGGRNNKASGRFASVSGGSGNAASGESASVSGGFRNEANGVTASISGGTDNRSSGFAASVSGGRRNSAGNLGSVTGGEENLATGECASVSGGWNNKASGYCASLSGGEGNEASGAWASVSGGESNEASGRGATVSGGHERQVTADYNWRAGDLFQAN